MKLDVWDNGWWDQCSVVGTNINFFAVKDPEKLNLNRVDAIVDAGRISPGDHVTEIGRPGGSAVFQSIQLDPGFSMEYLGHVIVDRDNPNNRVHLFNQCKDGRPVEYTRDLFGLINMKYTDLYLMWIEIGPQEWCINLGGATGAGIRVYIMDHYLKLGD